MPAWRLPDAGFDGQEVSLKKTAIVLTALAGALMVAGLTFVITFTVFHSYYFGGDSAQSQAVAAKTAELYETIDRYYIGEYDDQTLADYACAGMVQGIGDEWSYYITADEYSDYLDQLSNTYVGIGITILQQEDGSIVVQDVTEGGPAQQAGVQAGDVVVSVDGTAVDGMTVSELKELVRGEAGTTVEMEFLRQSERVSLTIERQSIEEEVVHAQLLDSGDGYIKIDNFDGGCTEKTIAAIEDLQAQGANSIIFDVRNNPGGLKDEVIALLDYLLPEGEIFHTVNFAGQEEISESDADYLDMPMAVLVNISSYSAAEYFAAALQEYDAAIIVGEQTYGKGYFQTALQLSDGSAVNLSIGKYYTPQGKNLAGVGITPDEVVELDDEAEEALLYGTLEIDEDLQLQTAISSLNPENT